MSERDDPDEMAVLWQEREDRRRRDKLFAHPDCRDPAHPGCAQCLDCGCREGECESKTGCVCRMTMEIANGDQ